MVLHLEGHVLQDLDEQLCRKLNKSQLAVCTSTTTRASCLMEDIVAKYFTNFQKMFLLTGNTWKYFYNHLPFALSFPGAVRPGMRAHPHRRRRNRDLRPDLFKPTVATKASHYFSLNHPPASGSCTSYSPPFLHPRSASIGILIVILAVYHGVVVPQARLNFYFFPTSTAAKKTCHFVSRLWKTFKAGNCLNAQAWLTLVDGLWVSLGRNEWDQNLSFVL